MKKICVLIFVLCSAQILFSAKAAQQQSPELDVIKLCLDDKNLQGFLTLRSNINNGIFPVNAPFFSKFFGFVWFAKQEYNTGAAPFGGCTYENFLNRVRLLVQTILQKYPDLDLNVVVDEMTPLIVACSLEDLELVKLLLKQKKIDPNIMTPVQQKTALLIACESSNLAIVDALIKDPRTNVNIAGADGLTPLLWACMNNKFELAQKLLQHPEIDINCKIRLEGLTPLMLLSISKACKTEEDAQRQLGLVRCMLAVRTKIPLNINAINKDNQTALMGACFGNNPAVAEEILNYPGVDINMADGEGLTALTLVCDNSALEDESAEKRNKQLQLVRLLLRAADIDINVLSAGLNALMYAVVNNFYEIFEVLLSDPRIDVNMQGMHGCTVLMLVCESQFLQDESLRYLERLLAIGADVNKQDEYGTTVLMFAANLGRLYIVERLLRCPDIDVMRKNNWGDCALSGAATPKIYTALFGVGLYTVQDLCLALSTALVSFRRKVVPLILQDLHNLQLSDKDIVDKLIQIHGNLQQVYLSAENWINLWKATTLMGSILKSQNVDLMRRFIPLLLTEDQDCENVDLDGNTVLHIALKYTVPQDISLLIAQQMSPQALQWENNDGYTVLKISRKLHQQEIEKYLEERLMPQQTAKAKEMSASAKVSPKSVAKQNLSPKQDVQAQAKTSAKKAEAKRASSLPLASSTPHKATSTAGEQLLIVRKKLQAINQKFVRIPETYQIMLTDMLGYQKVMVDFNHILKMNIIGNNQHGILKITLQGAHFDPVIQGCVQNNVISIEKKTEQKNGSSILYSLKNSMTDEIATKTVFAPSLTIEQICSAVQSAQFIKKIEESSDDESDVDVIIARATFGRRSHVREVYIKCVLERNFSESVAWQLKTAYPLTDQELNQYVVKNPKSVS